MKYVPKNDLPHPIAWVGFECKIVNHDPIETVVDRLYYSANPDYSASFNAFWNAPKPAGTVAGLAEIIDTITKPNATCLK